MPACVLEGGPGWWRFGRVIEEGCVLYRYGMPKAPCPWSISVRDLMKEMGEEEGRNKAAGTARAVGAVLGTGFPWLLIEYPPHGCEWGFALRWA